ncbi:PorT family protein [Maribacter algarum]|uniref:PorT family protein n=1 Tax=Maribacter algarum (ex Zhang et al. 2020) TaxID=2578118 RepID=A0A5S3PTB1_9FLAO|nr:porin family protein [Maribacter algarum]TMM55920.1 PorT family protein [Maribacter algarum]
MKKVLFTIILSFLFISGLQAQDDFKFGVTGGLITSRINNKVAPLGINLVNTTLASGTGFYVGGIASLGFGEKFGVQPELVYAKAGDLEYIQLPIMIKYYVIEGLYAQAGPQFSLSTNANKVGNLIEDLFNSNDIIGVNSLGVDIAFGAGYEILENLSAQARFSVELTNRIDGAIGSITKGKANNLTIGIAYFF